MKKSVLFLVLTSAIIFPLKINYETYVSKISRIPNFMREKEVKSVYGYASWYGKFFHGRLTSSREIYNMFDLTCAHRKWSFGTLLMVENTLNGKSTIVRINDRGPYIKGRIIDLSYGAAKELDMVDHGVVLVRITFLPS